MRARPAASTTIDAPLDVVWSVMLDTGAYGEWNPFVERAVTSQPPKVGNPIVLYVRWADGGTARSPERIVTLDPPSRTGVVTTALLAYEYEGAASRLGLVRGVRFQRLVQVDGRPTTYQTVEHFSGPAVRLAGPKRVADGFRRHAEALKARSEALARATP